MFEPALLRGRLDGLERGVVFLRREQLLRLLEVGVALCERGERRTARPSSGRQRIQLHASVEEALTEVMGADRRGSRGLGSQAARPSCRWCRLTMRSRTYCGELHRPCRHPSRAAAGRRRHATAGRLPPPCDRRACHRASRRPPPSAAHRRPTARGGATAPPRSAAAGASVRRVDDGARTSTRSQSAEREHGHRILSELLHGPRVGRLQVRERPRRSPTSSWRMASWNGCAATERRRAAAARPSHARSAMSTTSSPGRRPLGKPATSQRVVPPSAVAARSRTVVAVAGEALQRAEAVLRRLRPSAAIAGVEAQHLGRGGRASCRRLVHARRRR